MRENHLPRELPSLFVSYLPDVTSTCKVDLREGGSAQTSLRDVRVSQGQFFSDSLTRCRTESVVHRRVLSGNFTHCRTENVFSQTGVIMHILHAAELKMFFTDGCYQAYLTRCRTESVFHRRVFSGNLTRCRTESVFHRRVFSGNLTRCRTESVSRRRMCLSQTDVLRQIYTLPHWNIEVANKILYLIQSQNTDTGHTRPSADLLDYLPEQPLSVIVSGMTWTRGLEADVFRDG